MLAFSKPKLSYKQQIEHLKQKGIHFDKMSEKEALHYLQYHNYLFKLISYRKNYPKDVTNSRYLHLDFATLVDLAVIDMYLRSLVLKMSLNIEHFSKVNLLKRITDDNSEDGYSIVKNYLDTLSDSALNHINQELARNAKSPYCHQAYFKYKNCYPIWVFIEIISFGSFISFYKYCIEHLTTKDQDKYINIQNLCRAQKIPLSQSEQAKICRQKLKEDTISKSNFYLFLSIKRLRNAAAHNNCIISDLCNKSEQVYKRADTRMVKSLHHLGFSELTITNKLSNERVAELISCLYAHKCVVTSPGVNKHLAIELHDFTKRLFQHHNYQENNLIESTFHILSVIIDKWFPIV